nr:DUF982 domain-containing protein [Mesorhizobium sp. LNHC220B00]
MPEPSATLSNTQQAIGLLATHWRDAESRKQRSALRACRRATSGDLPPPKPPGRPIWKPRARRISQPDRERGTASGPTGNGGQRPDRPIELDAETRRNAIGLAAGLRHDD